MKIYTYLIPVILGGFLGFIGANSFLEGSWFNLVIWGVAGFLLEFIVNKPIIKPNLVGALYGFFLMFVFLLSCFRAGNFTFAFIIFSIIFSIAGALVGVVEMILSIQIIELFKIKKTN